MNQWGVDASYVGDSGERNGHGGQSDVKSKHCKQETHKKYCKSLCLSVNWKGAKVRKSVVSMIFKYIHSSG